MKLSLVAAVMVASMFGTAGSARADWDETKARWHSFWDRVHVDFHRNHCWPDPFRSIDNDITRAHLEAMMAEGWQRETTLTEHLFDPETQELTSAGRIKIHQILTQYPASRRSIFVLSGFQADVTAARLASVQDAVSTMALPGPPPDVLVTNIPPIPGSGDYYDRVTRGYQSSTPAPRLPASSGGGE